MGVADRVGIGHVAVSDRRVVGAKDVALDGRKRVYFASDVNVLVLGHLDQSAVASSKVVDFAGTILSYKEFFIGGLKNRLAAKKIIALGDTQVNLDAVVRCRESKRRPWHGAPVST